MAYYALQNGYELCGWKGLPFALRHPDQVKTNFFDQESYRVVYACDGRHDLDEDSLTEKQRNVLKHLLDQKIAVPADGARRLDAWQEYKCYPSMFKSEAMWSVTGRCNYFCRHCFMSAPDYSGEDLTPAQSLHILDELASCGIRVVTMTGGEPLFNPHFLEILDGMRERGMILGRLCSNRRTHERNFVLIC